MKNTSLEKLLCIFKENRELLILDFIKDDVEIFDSMFRYENNYELMNISIDKWLTKYINNHFKEKYICKEIEIEFSKAMVVLIKKFGVNNSNEAFEKSNELFASILSEKKEILNNIIHISNKDTDKFNKLKYSYQKDKVIFNREIKKIEGA